MNLQILLGRERGRVYPVGGGTYVIGRGSDCDLVLASDIVSRRHATIAVTPTHLRVLDLGSSNGTFVNGARIIGEGAVAPDDVLMVGDVAMRLCNGQVPALSPHGGQKVIGGTPEAPVLGISGTLTEVPVATVLRHLAVVKKTGVLLLTSPPQQARVTFTRGHISDVVVDRRKARDPVQALTSILRWRGTFEVAPPVETTSSALLGLDVVLPAVGTASRQSMLPRPQ
jgi:hypothetical protein